MIERKKDNLGFLNPQIQKTKEYVKTTKKKMQLMRSHKRVEFSNWQDSLRRFEVLLFEKQEIVKYVYAGKFEALPRYYASLYNIFNYMISLYPDEEYTKYSAAFTALFPKVHKRGKKTKEAIGLLMTLKRIDENLMQLKEKYGLGLASITRVEKDEGDLKNYITGDNNRTKDNSRKQSIAANEEPNV